MEWWGTRRAKRARGASNHSNGSRDLLTTLWVCLCVRVNLNVAQI